MGLKDKIKMMGIMAAMFQGMDGTANSSDLRPEDISVSPKLLPIPNGCKEYFFFDNGKYIHQRNDQCVFSCIAANPKNAYKKFEKYKLTNL